MSRIAPLAVESATGQAAQLFAGITRQIGFVPNLYRSVAAQPKTLEAVLHLHNGTPTLNRVEQQLIALAVGEANGCDYCLAAHTLLGKAAGLSDEEVSDARRGVSADTRRAALLKLTTEIVANRGKVSDDAYAAFIAAGYAETQIPEVLLAVTQNIFTNYFNNLNATEVDFPAAPKL